MARKAVIGLIIFSILILLGAWSPWKQWNLTFLKLAGFEKKEQYSGLKVKSLAGEIEVYFDNEFKDSISEEQGFLEVYPIIPGEHVINLRRKSTDGSYAEIVRKINFESGVDTVIGYEIGPLQEFSEGHILSARKSYTNKGSPLLEIISTPEQVNVSLDGGFIGQTPLKNIQLDNTKKHKLKFEKEGYDSLEIEILPDNQEDRDKLVDLILDLEINLFAQPVKVVTQ